MWIIYSLFGAFFQAVEMAIKKKALQTRGTNNFIAFAAFTFAGILLGAVFFSQTGNFWQGVANTAKFWQGIFWAVALNIVAVYFLYKALDAADLSYLMPFMTLTSLSIIIPPMVVFREFPSLAGFMGIAIVVAGALLMDYKRKDLRVAVEEEEKRKNNRKGLAFFLITALCFTVTPTAMKVAIVESSALFASFLVHILIGVSYVIFIIVFKEIPKIRAVFNSFKANEKRNFLLAVMVAGISIAVANGSINFALAEAPVAYVMAIKRVMPMFAFAIGYAYFKERIGVGRKLAATALMVIGAILITIFK